MTVTCYDILTTLTVYKAGVGFAAEVDHVVVTVCSDGEEWFVDDIVINWESGRPEHYMRSNPAFPLLEALVDRKHIESELQSLKEDA